MPSDVFRKENGVGWEDEDSLPSYLPPYLLTFGAITSRPELIHSHALEHVKVRIDVQHPTPVRRGLIPTGNVTTEQQEEQQDEAWGKARKGR